jgi:hypothetical protein
MTPDVDFYFQYCYRSQLGIFHSDCSVIFEIVMARYLFRIEKTTRRGSLSPRSLFDHYVTRRKKIFRTRSSLWMLLEICLEFGTWLPIF